MPIFSLVKNLASQFIQMIEKLWLGWNIIRRLKIGNRAASKNEQPAVICGLLLEAS